MPLFPLLEVNVVSGLLRMRCLTRRSRVELLGVYDPRLAELPQALSAMRF